MGSGDSGDARHADPLANADTLVSGNRPRSGRDGGGELVPGDTLSHFVVLEVAGEGGMGVVYSAYDPNLDRKVAIKVLRPEHGDDDEAARQRLIREAHALAKLNHENVVSVHEVFEIDDRAYVAMEHVEGGTLATWVHDEDPPWREVVARYRLAGRGLAAAHGQGLIHRDFKAANVLVGDDGRVRVTDFGLVRAKSEPAPTPARPPVTPPPSASPLSSQLTEHGAVVGTPGYVAPELYRGHEADERADQFSFCVSLYEALHGVKPFRGDTAVEIVAATLRGDRRELPADEIPAWIDRVLDRGLADDPDQRFPSMDQLLDALDDDPSVRRRRRLRLAALALAFVGLAGVAVFALLAREASPDLRCQNAARHVEEIWNPASRDAVRRSFIGTRRPYAAQTFDRVADRIDRYAGDWAAVHTDTCRATHVYGEQSAAALDRRMSCLDSRLVDLGALVELLSGPSDPQVLDRAVRSVANLPPPATCAFATSVAEDTVSPEVRAQRSATEREIARARALSAAGKYAEAAAALETLLPSMNAAAMPALRARALVLVGDLYDSLGRAEDADRALADAVTAAAPLGDDALDAEIWTTRLWVVGYTEARPDAAAEIARAAEVAVERAGERPRLRADLAKKLGGVYMRHGKYDQCRAAYERALAIVDDSFEAEHPERAVALSNLGNVLWRLGELDLARDKLELALELDRKTLGESHPDIAYSLTTLGNVYAQQGDLSRALALFGEALTLRENALGPDHPEVALSLSSAAQIHEREERFDQALALYRRAIEIMTRARGAEHPDVAGLIINEARTLHGLGRNQQARAAFERAIGILESSLGAEHPDIGIAALGLGEVEADEGRCAAAIPLFRRALALFERGFGADHPSVGVVRERLAGCGVSRP